MPYLEPEAVETVRVIEVPPDPNIFKALGLTQSFEAAVADLIDNSLDAEADRVLVRFIQRSGKLVQLLVIDNGRGMNAKNIDGAMQLGRRRKKSELKGHGFYGMGLKSASFGQASVLTVLSRKSGFPSEGRRMYREKPAGDFEVDVLSPQTVKRHLDELLDLVGNRTKGTVVKWDRVKDFPHSSDPDQVNTYVSKKTTDLNRHLGLTYHRILKPGVFEIVIDVYDVDDDAAGAPTAVEPVDPFGYPRRVRADYPKELFAELLGERIPLDCHIWPPRSESPEFRLYGRPVEDFQGLYLYRKKRLLSCGGWGGIIQTNRSYKLARVAIDIDDYLDFFKMSVDKSDVQLTSDLASAIESSQSETRSQAEVCTTFFDYLEAAKDVFQQGNKRQRQRPRILPPGQGLDPAVKRAIQRETLLLETEEPVRIRWDDFSEPTFIEMDRANRTLWLNKKYREAVVGGTGFGVNDAPLVKTLLFLLFEDLLRGRAMGPRDRETYEFWLRVLTAAADAQERRLGN